jgi:tripeptidyl-peptidase-2
VIQNKCDLVNYSFGEPINFTHLGPALSMLEQMIEKYGVIFCGSAGNNGPGIETVDCPGSFITASIGVAAYVSTEMIKAEHSLLGNGNSMLFTWSSRGPHLDGHYGKSFTFFLVLFNLNFS